MISVEIRKLIVKLYNEDKLLIGNISKTVGKSNSVIYSILRKLEETESCEAKKQPCRPRKTTAREDKWIGNESKKDRIATTTTISKRANAKLGIKILRHTISQRLNEINLNSWVASTKPYILKRTKWANWNLSLNMSYGLKNSGIVFISMMSQSLTCLVVTGEGSFDIVLRNNVPLSALKSVLNLKAEVWWCLAWFLLLVLDLLSG